MLNFSKGRTVTPRQGPVFVVADRVSLTYNPNRGVGTVRSIGKTGRVFVQFDREVLQDYYHPASLVLVSRPTTQEG